MKKLIESLRLMEVAIAKARGPFTFLGLIKRDDAAVGWDLVVSATWLNGGGLEQLRYISEHLKKMVGNSGMLEFARIVPLNTGDRFVLSMTKSYAVSNGWTEIRQELVGKVPVYHAIIITSRKVDDPKSAAMPKAATA